MSYYVDTSHTSCLDLEKHHQDYPCEIHTEEQIVEECGEVWIICSNCRLILGFQDMNTPIIKKVYIR